MSASCPSCRRPLHLPPGERFVCPFCGAEFAPPVLEATVDYDPPPRRRRAARRGDGGAALERNALYFLAAVAGALFIVGRFLLGWW